MTIRIDDTAHCRKPGVDPELFHPSSDADTARIVKAKRACAGCPFIDPCRTYALHNKVEGVWGATTVREREGIRRRHGIKAESLSFGSNRLDTDAVKRMYRRHTSIDEIAVRLGVTYEAVRLVIRADEARRAEQGRPPLADPTTPVACEDCGNTMRPSSLRKHRRAHRRAICWRYQEVRGDRLVFSCECNGDGCPAQPGECECGHEWQFHISPGGCCIGSCECPR